MKKKSNSYDSVFTRPLMLWHVHLNNRQMPWKAEKDPYKIWLSEIILQQTRVEQGRNYYLNFIKQYPTVFDLADAPEDEVMKLWEGLGYYSRCRNLLRAAKIIVEDYNGEYPSEINKLKSLPGVGPYTAAAIASFAFGLPYAVVDGNVIRVLSRFLGIKTAFDTSAGKHEFNSLADKLLDKQSPALYNQAIMDLGATVCTPKAAACHVCPLSKDCLAFKTNSVSAFPVKSKKIIKKKRFFLYFIPEYRGELYLRKRSGKDIWKGLHDFMLWESSCLPSEKEIEKKMNDLFPNHSPAFVSASPAFEQVLTHQHITAAFVHLRLRKPYKDDTFIRTHKSEIMKFSFPRLIHLFFEHEAAKPIFDQG